jgi:hypothetical protein
MAHQYELMNDAIYCDGSATERMVQLIEGMLKVAKLADPKAITQAFRAKSILQPDVTPAITLQPKVAAALYVQAVEVNRLRLDLENSQNKCESLQSTLTATLQQKQEAHQLASSKITQLENEIAHFKQLPSQRFKQRMHKIFGTKMLKKLRIA